MLQYFRFDALRLKTSWIAPAYVGIDNQGLLQYLSEEKPEVEANIETISGAVLPGFQNTHSHAFQYGMAGQAEQHAPGTDDDFWTWRNAMYSCANTYSPEQMEAVATALYKHMLRNGYTSVAEFHYVHHDEKGRHYNNKAEVGERLIAAAKKAGIRITLIPMFYQKGNFGKDPLPGQKRFISKTIDEYFELLEFSAAAVSQYDDANLAFGVHSLRAVDAKDIVATYEQGPATLPFHMHIAEQLAEVDNCKAYLGSRPIEWLLANLPVNDRFHLVHCTHMTDDETIRLAQSGAHAVLCPGTEGNLGDGIFNLKTFAGNGGHWSIGTDSHISLNPLEDLRWLDYAQRLTLHKRNTFDDGAATLLQQSYFSGVRAMGKTANDFFETGRPFDAVVYNMDQPLLAQTPLSHLHSAILYTADPSFIIGTMINGKWVYRR